MAANARAATNATRGCARCLQLLATFDFENEPLLLAFDATLTDEQRDDALERI